MRPDPLYLDLDKALWPRESLQNGRWGLPLPLIRALIGRAHNGTSDVSVTELASDSPQQAILGRRHPAHVDPESRWDVELGQALHLWIEHGNTEDVSSGSAGARRRRTLGWQSIEEPMRAKVGGLLVGARIDQADIADNDRDLTVLRDWKSVQLKHVYNLKTGRQHPERGNVASLKGIQAKRSSWIRQLAFTAVLCHLNEIKVERAEVVVIIRDWRRDEYQLNPFTYPPRVTTVPIDLPPIEVCQTSLELAVETWKALSDLDDDQLAEAHPCDTWRGLRCRDWCDVSHACRQYEKEKP